MAVICIAGVAPGIGKTAVAELVLRELGGRPRWGWHAARVRMADEIPEADAARVHDEGYLLLSAPDALDDDAEVQRFLDAGASDVTALVAEARGLEAGLEALLAVLPPDANLLVEGNAYLWARPADVAIMVVGTGPSGKGLARVRPSTREILDKVDLWAWNTRTDPTAEGFFEFPQALVRMGFRGAVSPRADFHHVHPDRLNHAGNRRFLAALRRRVGGSLGHA
ncbi:MAG: hypothetical protein WBD05_03065 [Phycisphaerae bacterium]